MSIANWHILVVEDEPDGQDVVTSLLGYFNIHSDSVATAEEALQLLAQNTYTAVISDLALPNMDGIALIKQIRANPDLAGLPGIAITAFHSTQVKQQALGAGFNAYFPKPLEDTAFVRELERIIGDAP